MKSLPVYDHTINSSLILSSGDMLYAIATKDQESYIMIYHPHHVYLDSLYKRVLIPTTWPIKGSIIYHADGADRDTVVMVVNGQLQFYRAPTTPYLTIIGHMNRVDYIHYFLGIVIIEPWDDSTTNIRLDLSMRMINK